VLDEDTIEKETGLSLKRNWRFTYQKEEPFLWPVRSEDGTEYLGTPTVLLEVEGLGDFRVLMRLFTNLIH